MKSRYVFSLTPVYAAAERCIVKHLRKIRFYGSREQTLDEVLKTPMSTVDLLRITQRVSAYTKELINELVRYHVFNYFLSASTYDEGELIYKTAMVIVGDDPEEIEENRDVCFELAERELKAIMEEFPKNRYLVAKAEIKNNTLYLTTGEDVRILQYELDHGVGARWQGQVFDTDGRVYDDIKPIEMDLGGIDQPDDREMDTLMDIISQELGHRDIIEDTYRESVYEPTPVKQPEHVKPTVSTELEEESDEADTQFIELEGLALYADQE